MIDGGQAAGLLFRLLQKSVAAIATGRRSGKSSEVVYPAQHKPLMIPATEEDRNDLYRLRRIVGMKIKYGPVLRHVAQPRDDMIVERSLMRDECQRVHIGYNSFDTLCGSIERIGHRLAECDMGLKQMVVNEIKVTADLRRAEYPISQAQPFFSQSWPRFADCSRLVSRRGHSFAVRSRLSMPQARHPLSPSLHEQVPARVARLHSNWSSVHPRRASARSYLADRK